MRRGISLLIFASEIYLSALFNEFKNPSVSGRILALWSERECCIFLWCIGMFVLTNFNEIKKAFSGAQNLRTWDVTEYYFLTKEINQVFQLNYFKRQPSYFIRAKNHSSWRIQGILRQIQFNRAALLLWKKIQWTIYLRTPTWNWEGHLHALACSTSRRLKSGDLHSLACGSADENGTKLWAPFQCKILTNSKFSQRLRSPL